MRPEPRRSVSDQPTQSEHGVDIGLGIVGPALHDSVRRGECAQAVAEQPVDLDARADHRRVQRRRRPHQIEDIGPRVPVRICQKNGM